MSTLVCFHAHPDDESSQTSGLLATAAAQGHRCVVVTATDGSEGELHTELDPGETLAERRKKELGAALAIIGCEPPVMLGYKDSGMMGEPANDNPECFWQADVEAAAEKLAAILTELDADVLTYYDDHGGYGHPDHIQVHRVGKRAAELAGVAHTFESTMNRDRIQAMMKDAPIGPDGEQPNPEDFAEIGTADRDIAYIVDTREFAGRKREALRCHASQMAQDNFFMSMPDEVFTEVFGYECYNLPGVTNTGGPEPVSILPGLDPAVAQSA